MLGHDEKSNKKFVAARVFYHLCNTVFYISKAKQSANVQIILIYFYIK